VDGKLSYVFLDPTDLRSVAQREVSYWGIPVLSFEWDSDKAVANKRKHWVGFSEAATAFGDPLSLTVPDVEHSVGEARWVLVGVSYRGRLLVVVHVERGNHIRLISARLATRAERKTYEQDE
jgi:uncharacterized protein